MKILICDDEQQYIDKLKMHVEKFMQCRFINYEIVTSKDPQIILKSNDVYQLAFLDIQMDEIDGISLAKTLKERNHKIVIFFVRQIYKRRYKINGQVCLLIQRR